ncbi:class B sortase [Olsenella urininfantis]|uniref:class B sortase n=1 Tax=Olsenella urininfantis TaxID=1871033 RepID=UPI001F27BA36|nr:class B sortase [Olsenella urininfantis]
MPEGSGKHMRPAPDARPAQASGSQAMGMLPVAAMEGVRASGKKPRKGGKGRRSRIVANVLIVVGILLLLAAAGLWGFSQWRYHEQDVINQKLARYAEVTDRASDAPQVDWEGLKAVNKDVIGWLYIPGTNVNYPVYQGADNDQYLRHSAEGEWTIAGQLFMDYENRAPGLVDNQSIIYGHHMQNGTMFQQIAALDDQENFDKISTIWYVTEQGSYELEPLLLYYTNPEDTNVRQFSFGTQDEFHSYLSGLLSKAVTKRSDASQVIAGTDHVLTMSTCNYYDGYGRTIFVCVPKAEASAASAQSS